MRYWLWINQQNHKHLAIKDDAAGWDVQKAAERLGWQFIWDSAPSEFAAAKYANDAYDCPSPCIVGESDHPLT